MQEGECLRLTGCLDLMTCEALGEPMGESMIVLSQAVQKCYDCSQSICEHDHARRDVLKEKHNVAD